MGRRWRADVLRTIGRTREGIRQEAEGRRIPSRVSYCFSAETGTTLMPGPMVEERVTLLT